MKVCLGNELYGHGQTLRTYCGVSTPAVIRGRIQHGWSAGRAVLAPDDDLWAAKEPIYVWTEREAEWLCDYDGQVHVIGAPILYLPETPTLLRSGTLAVPGHSIDGKRIPLESWSEYARWLAGINCTEVLLHPKDYTESVIAYMQCAGVTPVTAGGSIFDPQYLLTIVRLMRSAERVISNVMCTALLYAAYLETPAFVDGPPTKTVPSDWYDADVSDPRWTAERYPVLNKTLALRELGAEHKRTPGELFELLFTSC